MRTVRSVLRALGALTAVFAWAGGLVLAVPSAHAAAASPQPLAISITGMTPSYATRGSTVTLTGTLANHTGAAVSGLTVQAETSPQNFTGRAEMTGFTRTGSYPYPGVLPAGQAEVTGTVRDGQTIRWSVSFQAGSFSTIGVFPVQVAAATPGGTQTAAARTLLPYWPGSGSFRQAKDSQLQVAWIWPLADTPQQGACGHTLATNELAGSVDGGRLSALVGAAASWASADDLTWDIDPALLSDVSVMKGAYYTGGTGTCSSRVRQPPSKAAARWLGQLRQASTGRPAFLTPYANVDVAALSHAGLDGNVRSAYQLGQTVAGQILPGTFGDKGTGTAGGAVLKAAWPADGLADAGVLTSLATYGGISTAVLSSGAVSSVTPGFDNAIARTQVSGIGTAMSVLLADDQMTSLLGATPAKPTASGQFAYTQDYLAQTAMIVSEAPGLARSLVVAPPPDWNPSASEAAALLRTTHDMPWLKTTGLSALAAQAAKQPPASAGALPAKKVSGDELSASSVAGLKSVNSGLSLFTNLLYQPSPAQTDSLRGAVAVAASSAWRGAGAAGGRRATVRLQRYLSSSEAKVQIIPITKVLLAGNSGETPVSVKNGLGWPVQVRVTASAPAASTVRVGPHEGLLTVMGGKTNTVRMPVHATSIGTTTVQLQLVTQDGSPLGTAQSLSVEVTRVGRFLLTIIGGALGILVLTSVYQLRRKRLARTRSQGTADHAGDAGGAG
jgi:hypothetical protein